MIIIADVPFFDAFSYASNLSGGNNLSYWSPGEEVPSVHGDIFLEALNSSVCLISKLSHQKDIDVACKLAVNFKALIVWDSDFDAIKKYCDLNKLDYKFVQIPKYISLRDSVSKCDTISKDIVKNICLEIDGIPLSSRIHRDFVSSIVHKISVIYSDANSKCSIADVALGSPVSMLDITSAFCSGEESFFNFCYYYFGKSNEVDSNLKSWISMLNKFLISEGNLSHEIYRHGGVMSVKLNEVVANKLSSCIKSQDFLYCLMCVSHIISVNNLDDFILSTSLMRSSLSGKLNKKQSINIIRNLNE